MAETWTDRFHSRYVKADGCWEWIGGKNRKGYGQIRTNEGVKGAHRVAWMLRNGEIPKGLYVLHACDNPGCVNPDHLSVGTQTDNMRQCIDRGRFVGGGSTPKKLHKFDMAVIEALRNNGMSWREVARTLGVAMRTAWKRYHAA